MGVRGDLKVMETAIRKRWELTQEQKGKVVEKVMSVLSDPVASGREILAAARVAAALEGQNQIDEHKQVDVIQRGNRFLEIAQRLKLDGDFGDTIKGTADPNITGTGCIGNKDRP